MSIATHIQFRPYDEADIPDLTLTINSAFAADKFFKLPQYYDRASHDSLRTALSHQTNGYLTYLVGALPSGSDSESLPDDLRAIGNIVPCSTLITHLYQLTITYIDRADPTTLLTATSDRMSLQDLAGSSLRAIFPTLFTTPQSEQDDHPTALNSAYQIQSITPHYVPSISTVSVHEKIQGKGLGKVLIAKSEDYILHHLQSPAQQQLVNNIFSHLLIDAGVVQSGDVTALLPTNEDWLKVKITIQLEVLIAVRPELGPFYTKLGYTTISTSPFSYKFICLPEYNFDSTLMEKHLVQ